MDVLLAVLIFLVGFINFVAKVVRPLLRPLQNLSQQNTIASIKLYSRLLLSKHARAEQRSKAIDKMLEEDSENRRLHYQVLVYGSCGPNGMKQIVRQIRNNNNRGLTEDERIEYRHNVHQYVVTHTRELLELIETSDIRLKSDVKPYYDYLCDYLPRFVGVELNQLLNEEFGRAVEAIWSNLLITEGFTHNTVEDLKRGYQSVVEKKSGPVEMLMCSGFLKT